MNIALISLDQELFCLGVRTLSSCLRSSGHDTRLIFMIPPPSMITEKKFQTAFSERLLINLKDLLCDVRLIGISLMSNQFVQAVNITEYLKSHGVTAPIIWGGIEATVEPDECLRYADMVCLGEGEEALVELVDSLERKEICRDIRNVWFKTLDGIVRNPIRPLIQDLDAIPFPDYSCRNHFVAVGDSLNELTRERFLSFEGERFRGDGTSIPYMFMTSRGCPYSCTYCGNSVYKRLYHGQKLLRWRSDENIIDELLKIQQELAPISYVYMVDDNFTARPTEKLRSFCDRYRVAVGIPFYAQVSPLTISEEKMAILFGSGCAHITMGVETASERVAAMYNRSQAHKSLPKAIALIEKYRSKMDPPPTYQFIIDNPYETVDEMIETLRLAASFPRPWYNPIYSLMLFPGVPLYHKAVDDGIIKDKYSQIYRRNWRTQSRPFFQFWIRLYRANLPPFLVRAFLARWVVKILASAAADVVWRMKIFRWLWNKTL